MLKRGGEFLIIVAGILALMQCDAAATENQLTPEEKKDGWILLFDGKSTKDWMTSRWEACPEALDEGAINPDKCPNLGPSGWDLVYERPWADFILELDFKISPKTNSGVMVRIWPLKPLPHFDVEYNGLEVQIEDSQATGYYDTGAIYDLVKPAKNAMKSAEARQNPEAGSAFGPPRETHDRRTGRGPPRSPEA